MFEKIRVADIQKMIARGYDWNVVVLRDGEAHAYVRHYSAADRLSHQTAARLYNNFQLYPDLQPNASIPIYIQ